VTKKGLEVATGALDMFMMETSSGAMAIPMMADGAMFISLIDF